MNLAVHRIGRRLACFAVAAAALAACGSSTAPRPGSGEPFVLVSVGGAALPVALQNSAGEARDLSIEFLTLYADGAFRLETGLLPPGRRASEVPSEGVNRRGRYTRAGAQLTLRFTCAPADLACPQRYVGMVGPAGAELREAGGTGAVRVYERSYYL
jgi:hypothetical protein